MSWLSYLIPKQIARFSSQYNRDICILEEAGRLKLLVNGSRQSGAYIEMLWRDAFGAFRIDESLTPKRILVLGVGGGTVIHLLSALYPESAIDAVDIDATMIRIGRDYFGLGKLPRVRLIHADAKTFVESTSPPAPYDIVVVDLFCGREIPSFVNSVTFIRSLSRMLARDGMLLINYLRENEYRQKSHLLLDKLRQIFESVNDREIFNNRFFYIPT